MALQLKHLFYYFLVFLVAVFLVVLLGFLLSFLLRFLFRYGYLKQVRGKRVWGVKTPVRRSWMWGYLLGFPVSIWVSQLLLGHSVFGLGFVFVTLFISLQVYRYRRECAVRDLEDSTLSFLWSVRGMVRAGLSLPTAVMVSAQYEVPHFYTPIASFDQGKSFTQVMERLGARTQEGSLSMVFSLLNATYEKGISVTGVLERGLPLIQKQIHQSRKIKSLQKSILVQGGIITLLPWLLLLVLFYFQRPMVQTAFENGFFRCGVIFSLVIEAIGFRVLCRISKFY